MITISDKALSHVISLMEQSGVSLQTHKLRVGVKGGGCSGISYTMDFDNVVNDQSDDVFEVGNELQIIVDKKSLLYLIGTELNYSDGLNGKGFEWVNPNASRTCGCGESFSL